MQGMNFVITGSPLTHFGNRSDQVERICIRIISGGKGDGILVTGKNKLSDQ